MVNIIVGMALSFLQARSSLLGHCLHLLAELGLVHG